MFWDLFLEGDISAASARKGDGFATFSINDIGVNTLPGAPYQNGQYWGFARSTADAGFFVLEEIPGGIRVATSTANGAMVRVGYAMTSLAEGRFRMIQADLKRGLGILTQMCRAAFTGGASPA